MIKLINGDCLEELKRIEDKSINLILIDPPYNIKKAKWDTWKTVDEYVMFMGKVFKELERVLKDNGSFYFFHNDFLQIVELQNYINKNTRFKFKQLITWNKTKFKRYAWTNRRPEKCKDRNFFPNIEYCLFYTFEDGTGLECIMLDMNNFKELRNYSKQLQEAIGLKLKDINKVLGHRRAEHFFYHSSTQWDKPTEAVYQELIDIFGIDKLDFFKPYEQLKAEYEAKRLEYEAKRLEYEAERYTFNLEPIQDNISCIWESNETNTGKLHPCEKPQDILQKIIKTSSNEGGTILDCFMGSGSTGVAALNTNRNFIGIELDKNYFEIAQQRIKEAEHDNL